MADGSDQGQGLGGLAFALAWVRNPRRVGAIAPASKALAQAMADEVARVGPGLLIEIGAGTGAITQALARLGAPPDRGGQAAGTGHRHRSAGDRWRWCLRCH